MRNFILLLLSTLLLFACSDSQKSPAESNFTKALSKPVKNNLVLKDTTPKPAKKRYSFTDPSRPKDEIDPVFPFDIDLKTADGEVIKSSNVLKKNGKPTVILFWLTTCYPCRIEMAAIEKEIPKWQKEVDFNIVAISTDFETNYPNFVKRVHDSNWPFEAYNDFNREFRKVMPGELNGLHNLLFLTKPEILLTIDANM